MPKHKKNPAVGQKTTYFAKRAYIEQEDAESFAQGEEVTFMDWGNAFVNKSNDKKPIQSLDVKLHLQGDFKKTDKKITWLAITESAPLVSVILKDYDYLITKARIEDADNWLDFINPQTEFRYPAYADANIEHVKKGDIIQFERKGYYICDKEAIDASPMEFILIPDGKAAAVALKAKPATAANGTSASKEKAANAVNAAATTTAKAHSEPVNGVATAPDAGTSRTIVRLLDLQNEDVGSAYDAAHAQVPREVLDSHTRFGIHEMTIHRHGTRLVMLITVDANYDPEGLEKANETDPILADWQRRMTALQKPVPGAPRWVEAPCVFRQSEQLATDRSATSTTEKAIARIEPVASGLPEFAPSEAVQQHVDSRGLSIPVKTKVGDNS